MLSNKLILIGVLGVIMIVLLMVNGRSTRRSPRLGSPRRSGDHDEDADDGGN